MTTETTNTRLAMTAVTAPMAMPQVKSLADIPDCMKALKQWLLWCYEYRNGKPTKRPLQIDGKSARVNDSTTWSDFKTAANASGFDGLGYVFAEGDGLVGIDIDHCITSDGAISPWAKEILQPFQSTYVEKSPSGTGFHIICRGKAIATGAKKWKDDEGQAVGFEIYDHTSPRYFTVTGDAAKIINNEVIARADDVHLNDVVDCQEQLNRLHQMYWCGQGPVESKRKPPNSPPRTVPQTTFLSTDPIEDVRDALTFIPAEDYHDWVKTLAALKSGGVPVEEWHEYSRKSPKYDYDECQAKWDQLKPNGTRGLGSIFHEARLHGWKPRYRHSGKGTQMKAQQEQPTGGTRNGGGSGAPSEDICTKASSGGSIDTSQLGLARKTAENIGICNLIYTRKSFFSWSGKVWEESNDERIKQIIIKVGEAVNDHLEPKLQKELTVTRVNAVLGHMRTQCFAGDIEFDSPNDAICCLNGELHPAGASWELRPHRRESYKLSLLPVEYDPSATAPRFEQFLKEVFKDDPDAADKIECILQFLRYSLTTNCRFEKFIILVGAGENGKSILLGVFTNLVGNKNAASVDPSQFGNKFQRAYLFGKLVNLITEISEGRQIDDGSLKAITSGEPMTAEHKGKDPFTFRPCCKCWFGTNHLPHTRDTSHAFFRRAILIEFNNKFKKANDPSRTESDQLADVLLAETLRSENQGIFNLALAALSRLREQGGFTEPASSVAARTGWKLGADQVAQFVDEQCMTGKGLTVPVKELFCRYADWAAASGIRKPFTKNAFGRRLASMGFIERATASARYRDGIEIASNKLGEVPE